MFIKAITLADHDGHFVDKVEGRYRIGFPCNITGCSEDLSYSDFGFYRYGRHYVSRLVHPDEENSEAARRIRDGSKLYGGNS